MPEGSRDDPVHVKAVRDGEGRAGTYVSALRVINQTVMTAYAVFMAWEVAKAICPPLRVQEQVAIARARLWWESRRRERHVVVPPAWVRDIYDSTRGGEPGGP